MRIYVAPNVYEALKRVLPEPMDLQSRRLPELGWIPRWICLDNNEAKLVGVEIRASEFVPSGYWMAPDGRETGCFPVLVDRDPATMTDAELRAALGLKEE